MGIAIIKKKIDTLVENKSRTFPEILEGKKAYSEVLAYRIEKYDATDVLLQTIYLPNSPELKIMTYIDTQIKYNNEYTYKVYSHNVVIGSKYRYDFEDHDGWEWWKWKKDNLFDEWTGGVGPKIFVHLEPSVKIIEAPYFMVKGRVMDDPPVFPDVDIIPYKDINNKLLMNLNSGFGEYNVAPIALTAEDEKDIADLWVSQNLAKAQAPIKNSGGKGVVARISPRSDLTIRFKNESDERIKLFEVYRTSKKPTSYLDFRGKLFRTIETNCEVNSVSLIDNTIKPNQKYYYIFRVKDVHDHFSNPTAVYEAELVYDKGAVFLLMNTIEMVPESPKAPSKSAQKLIQISPSLRQTFIDKGQFTGETKDSATKVKNLQLGLRLDENDLAYDPTDSVWNESFKVRLTSKKTGRKIDLKIAFSHDFTSYQKESKDETEKC